MRRERDTTNKRMRGANASRREGKSERERIPRREKRGEAVKSGATDTICRKGGNQREGGSSTTVVAITRTHNQDGETDRRRRFTTDGGRVRADGHGSSQFKVEEITNT